ncbi:MAG: type II toxin-antitoxin system PemK/MazF family toxin [Chloroflexi bacterium]|nr:type II toxin-antitoxin system PemK/MazF family toxin [Chloroflexota bacterium]
MARILRGGIYWADLDPVRGHEQGGARPVLVLSHDLFNDRSGTVIALTITSQPQRVAYPLTWKIPPGILPKDSWVKISQIRTLSTERLRDHLGQLGEHDLDEIVSGLVQLIR